MNQNPGCNSPLDNDGGNETQQPMNFEECWGHDPEIIINNITMYGDWWGIFGPFYFKRYIT
jgi:hypothetical protein